jgi:multidrug efflux pump subunit AcrA (membrane-fusion protein)
VTDGERVEEGQRLVTFESEHLQREVEQSRVTVEIAMAGLMKARVEMDLARTHLAEYIDGASLVEEKQLQLDVLDAEVAMVAAIAELETLKETSAGSAAIQAAEFQVKREEASLDLAKAKLNVFEQFTKKRVMAELEGNVERSQAEIAAAEQALQLEKIKLEKASIDLHRSVAQAPMAGIVKLSTVSNARDGSRIAIAEGNRVREGQLIARIMDPESFGVDVVMSEAEIELIEVGLEVSVAVDAFPDKSFAGKVASIDRVTSATGRTREPIRFRVRIELADSDVALRPGMTVQAAIHTN